MLRLLVLPTVRAALRWVVRVPLLMCWVSLPPVSLCWLRVFPLVRVLWFSVWVVLVWLMVAVLVWVSQLLVPGVRLGVVGRWVLLGAGARHSWLTAWWVLLVGLPLCLSGVSGGPAASLAEGCWALVLWVFPCCVRLWCGRCSRFGVLCVFVELVLVAAVVVCVVCARGCVWCVGGAFGCLSTPLWASFGGSVWMPGLCFVVPLPPWLWGPAVVTRHPWLGSFGGGVFPCLSPCLSVFVARRVLVCVLCVCGGGVGVGVSSVCVSACVACGGWLPWLGLAAGVVVGVAGVCCG